MQTLEFCQTMTTELHRNKTRCEEIDETCKALEVERRALQARNQALESVGLLFQSSQQVVNDARTQQARLNPAALYRSSQQVADEVSATQARMNEVIEDAADPATDHHSNDNAASA